MSNTKIAKASLFVAGLASIAIALMSAVGSGSAYAATSLRPKLAENTPTPPAPPTVTTPPLRTPAPVPTTGGDVPTVYADPYVLKSASQYQLKPGDTFEYVLVVGNKGNTDAVNVQIKDDLPPGIVALSASTTKGTVLSGSGKQVVVDIGSVGVNEIVTIKISAQVSADAKPGSYTNVVILTTTSGGDDPNNNSSSATVVIGEVVNPPTGAASTDASVLFLVFAGLALMGTSLFVGRRKQA